MEVTAGYRWRGAGHIVRYLDRRRAADAHRAATTSADGRMTPRPTETTANANKQEYAHTPQSA